MAKDKNSNDTGNSNITEDSIKNLSDSVKGLNKTLEKTNASYLEISSKTKEIKDNTDAVNKTLEKKSSKLLDGLYNTLDKMVDSSESIVGMITGGTVIASLGTIAKHAWDLNDSMAKLSVRMGQGKEGAKALEGSVTGMMKSFGSNYDQAKDIVETLAQAKYADNLQEAASGADLFARATGASVGTVVQLTDALNKQAGMSAKSSNAILAGMTKIQQTVGISQNGMEALAGSINDMALNMAAFGKSSEEIQRAAVKTTALAGAMEKVGVSAQRAVALMDQLTDPDRIEDNILLYSQLGLSIEDALNGGVQDALEGDAFKEMAEKITAMGPIAGAAMAKNMGLSYKEVSRMAQMETGSMNDLMDDATIEEDKALGKLDEFVKETEGIGAKVKRFFNEIEGRLMGVGPILLTTLTLIAPKILELFKGLVGKLTNKEAMQEAVQASVDTAEEGVEKVADASEKIKDAIEESVEIVGSSIVGKISSALSHFRDSGINAKQEARQEGITNAQRHVAEYKNTMDKMASLKDDKGNKLINVDEKGNFLGINGDVQDAGMKKLQNKLAKRYQKLEAITQKWEGRLSESDKTQMEINKKQQLLNKVTDDAKEAEEAMFAHSKKIAELQEMRKNASKEMKKIIDERIAAEKKAMNESISANQAAKEAMEEYGKEINDMTNNLEQQGGEKKQSGLGKIFQGIGTRVQAGFENVRNNLAERGNGSVGLGLAKAAGGAIGGALGSIAKTIGPMAIVMGIVSKLLEKIEEPLSNLTDNLIGELEPVIKPIMDSFISLLNIIAKTMLPPMLKLLGGLLSVLNFILKPITLLLKSLKDIPIVGKTLSGVGDMLETVTGSGKELSKAADNIAKSDKDLAAAVEENTDTVEESTEEKGPAVIEVKGGQAVMTSGSSSLVNSSVGSTTQTTQTATTDEEKNKEANKETREKTQVNELMNQTDILKEEQNILAKIASLLSDLLKKANMPSFNGDLLNMGLTGANEKA